MLYDSIFFFTLRQAGLIGKWRTDVMDEIRSESRQKRRREESNNVKTVNGKIKPLTLVHLQGPLFLYFGFTIVSLIAFLIEKSSSVCLSHRRTK